MDSMGASSRRTRKPFSDCTNTFESLNPSQSSSNSTKNSSFIKRSELISENTGKTSVAAKSSKTDEATKGDVSVSSVFRTLKSSFPEGTASAAIKPRNLISANTSKKSVATKQTKTQADQATGSSTSARGKGYEKLTEPGDILLPPVSTPSRTLKPSFAEDTTQHEAFEASPIYVRRQSAVKSTRKEKKVVVPKSCSPATKTRSKRENMNEAGGSRLSKSCPPPHRKRQRRTTSKEDDSIHALPQDFIEKQKAYFADIDAFELLEEEVDVLSEEEAS